MTRSIKKTAVKLEKPCRFLINCSKPVEDKVLKMKEFSDFLCKRIKIGGELGKLQDKVLVKTEDRNVVVDSKIELSKRYLKYLTKKYLKKHKLRDYLYVAATNKTTYEIKYFNLDDENAKE